MIRRKLGPTGKCWCGCGETTGTDRFFRPGHDRKAETRVIKQEYGGIPEFLEAHGYGPDGRTAKPDRRRA